MKGILQILLALLFVIPSLHSQIITEFHYDNIGGDVNEFVEFIIPNNGCDYHIELYNGESGMTYDVSDPFTCTTPMSEICDTEIDGCLFVFEPATIQNGNPDGMALVQDCGGTLGIVQFMSYEGTFTASNGSAAGLLSLDIAVNETGSTPIGSSIVYTGSGTVFTGSGYTVTSDATPGGCNNGSPLPITLLEFTAHYDDDKGVILDWTTSSEIDNDYFIIEHSLDGRDFNEFRKVAGAGTTSEMTIYQEIHENAPAGTNYYRLKQVNYNGQYAFSETREVFVPSNNVITIRPTLADNEVTVVFSEAIQQDTKMQVYDIAGRLVLQSVCCIDTIEQKLDVSKLQGGSYFITLLLNDALFSSRFVKI